MKINRFIIFSIVLTVITGALWLIYFCLTKSDIIPWATYTMAIFATQYILTLFVFFIILRASSSRPDYFVKITMLSVVLRLIIYGAFNFVIIYFLNGKAHQDVVLFFAVYIVFTVLEIGMLYKEINARSII